MGIFNILGIALGLAMDAFAVAIASSSALRQVSPRQYFRLSFHFGLFQFLMPVLGWLLGSSVERWTEHFDHWVAFGLLVLIGIRMIHGALREHPEARLRGDPTRGVSLLVLSVATSIDALAVGIGFGMLSVGVWYPSTIIGLVAAAMTLLGMRMGGQLGERFGRKMEIIGGLVLIAIGTRILFQHLF